MKISVTARHFELTEALRDQVEQRLRRLERYHQRISHVDVTLTKEKREKRVEALAGVDGDVGIHAEARASDFGAALGRVSDKLARQLKRRHDRHRDHQAPRLGRDIVPQGVTGGDEE